MSKQTLFLTQLHVRHLPIPHIAQRFGNLPLLPRREQDIARHAHDERRMVPQARQARNQVRRRLCAQRLERVNLVLVGGGGRRAGLLLVRDFGQRQAAACVVKGGRAAAGSSTGKQLLFTLGAASNGAQAVLAAEVEQIHGFADVQETVGVVG